MEQEAMINTLLERYRSAFRDAHSRVLALVEDLTDEQLSWRPGSHAPSIGFHVWHLARWADHDLSAITGRPQLWRSQGLAAAWGFPAALGEDDTGTEIGDDASELLVLPGKAVLTGYARSAFGAVDQMLDGLKTEDLLQLSQLDLAHENRHLGMIEALRGFLDLRGTATR